jgi:hypothetical protein
MTYILDMAGGTEYLGDELNCPASGAPLQRRDPQVELQLAIVETRTARTDEPGFFANLDVGELLDRLED